MSTKEPNWIRYAKYSSIGIEMAASVAVGAFIGYWLDGYFGTEPWLMIFWLICGVAAGFRSLFRMTKNLQKEKFGDETEGSDGT